MGNNWDGKILLEHFLFSPQTSQHKTFHLPSPLLTRADQPTRRLYLSGFTTTAANGSVLYLADSLCKSNPSVSPPPPPPPASYGLDEIQTLCGSILKWPNSVSRRAKWKVVKSFEALLHYNSSKHIQLGPKFREDIKALLHVSSEDDNNWAPLKLLRRSTIKGPRGTTPHTSYWLLMACAHQTQPVWDLLYLLKDALHGL